MQEGRQLAAITLKLLEAADFKISDLDTVLAVRNWLGAIATGQLVVGQPAAPSQLPRARA